VADLAGNVLGQDEVASFRTANVGTSPHGGYTPASYSCAVCHDVHGAAPSEGEFGLPLGRLATQTEMCNICHDGTGADTDVATVFTEASSGHELEDSAEATGAGLTKTCSSCHGPHFDRADKPMLYRPSINEHEVTADDNSWCQACHDEASSWSPDYPYPGGGVSPDKPERDPDNGYPVKGTFPGPSTYAQAGNAHGSASGGAVWPGSDRPAGDCRNCHAAHGSESHYDSLLAQYRPTPKEADAAAVATERQNGTYAELCLTCHDGSPGSDIKQYVTFDHDKVSNDYNGGHRIRTGGGNLPSGAPLPCYDCHNPHGSKGNNGSDANSDLLSDEQWSGIDTSTTDGTVDFCMSCHLPWEYAAGSAQPEANSVPQGQREAVEGLDRRAAGNALSLSGVVPEHSKANMQSPVASCYECHGKGYGGPSATTGFNVHRPARGKTCLQCHETGQDAGDGGPSRRAVVGEFGAAGGHHVAGQVTSRDCGVCHQEADAATGSVVTAFHKNNALDLRNPDTGDGTGLAAFESFRRVVKSPSLESWVTSVQDNLCLSCHDADGAASPAAQVPGASARQPFSSTGAEAADIAWAVNSANDFSHAVQAAGANPYANEATMVAPLNRGGTHTRITCFDCHVETAGHGGGGGKMARYAIGNPATAPNYAAMQDLCLSCHASSVYVDGAEGSRWRDHAKDEHQLGATGQGCRACHAGISNNSPLASNGAPGNIHGGNFTWPVDSGSPNLPTSRFLYGGYLGGWQGGTCWPACHGSEGY
jgi:hypothetical protein